jgi:hypothetical protein
VSQLVEDVEYYYQFCVQYQNLAEETTLVCSNISRFTTAPYVTVSNQRFRVPSIGSSRVTDITAGEASFTVSLIMNNGRDGTPFLVYGTDREDIVAEVSDIDSYRDVDEKGDRLQAFRLDRAVLGRASYPITLEELEIDTTYYFLACVEYDGERDGVVCERINQFTTDARDRDDKPRVTTGNVVERSSYVRVGGSIRMRDFNDGLAFFVYGTDESMIDAIEANDSFNRIRQSIDGLQKRAVDDNVDGNEGFTYEIRNLNPNTIYYYRACLQYVDEDERNREEFVITCGDIESFTR